MLHVTNGDHAADRIREAGIPGELLPWRDVLHEGPVPAGLDASALRSVRARFLAQQGWAEYHEILRSMEERDAALGAHDEIVLWFEHDLYDQLQLIQVLDVLAGCSAQVSLLQADNYLGSMAAEGITASFSRRKPVTRAQMGLAQRAWAAFRAPAPHGIAALMSDDLAPLPYLGAALHRWLEDLPSLANGLSRTEQQAVQTIADGACDRIAAFQRWQQYEEITWMGDASFFLQLERLAAGSEPLLAGNDGQLHVTERGSAVLLGRDDWVRLGGVDRWWGGVHLHGSDISWRWDGARQEVTTL